MNKYIVKLNGEEYEVEIEEVTADSSSQSTQTKASTPAPQPSKGGEAVCAPMAGNILAVKVSAGDQVKEGQVIAILEAMKMETEIFSPVDGVIGSVSVSVGQAINAGETIAQIN